MGPLPHSRRHSHATSWDADSAPKKGLTLPTYTEISRDHYVKGVAVLEDIRHKWSLRDRPARAAPAPVQRPTPRTRPEHEPHVPESGTERWKRQVEAEARHRLKRVLKDIGARRS